MTDTPERFTLKHLPLPAKLVLTVFLLSVGLGYLSAMVQIHFKHASAGNPMPTLADMVSRFSGQPWPLQPKPDANGRSPRQNIPPANPPAGQATLPGIKLKTLINDRCAWCHGPDGEKSEVPLTNFGEIGKVLGGEPAKGPMHKVLESSDDSTWSKDNMAQAFTKKSFEDENDWATQKKARPEADIRKERETERMAIVAWLKADASEAAYENDAFPLPKELAGAPLLERLKTMAAPIPPSARSVWEKAKQRQISVESLTQSTHAHLLSFSMLWMLTGLIFAFTSYSLKMRIVIAPIVLAAQVFDIACWWLARLEGIGPYFAIAIMFTGLVVGAGLGAQIMLSLFNMYDKKGKAVLLAMFAIGAGLLGWVYMQHVAPEFAKEKTAAMVHVAAENG